MFLDVCRHVIVIPWPRLLSPDCPVFGRIIVTQMVMEMFVQMFVSFLLVPPPALSENMALLTNIYSFINCWWWAGPTLLVFVLLIVLMEVVVCVAVVVVVEVQVLLHMILLALTGMAVLLLVLMVLVKVMVMMGGHFLFL